MNLGAPTDCTGPECPHCQTQMELRDKLRDRMLDVAAAATDTWNHCHFLYVKKRNNSALSRLWQHVLCAKQSLLVGKRGFGEKSNGVMKTDTNIPGSQILYQPWRPKKAPALSHLHGEVLLYKWYALLTRRQQSHQPHTRHIPALSICILEQEAKGFLPAGRGKSCRPRAPVVSHS